ncbi:MAG: DUF927 domain-containing protein [Siculibacillus sp.]|nr:DUF927 domain-containing protein [Siculibacillus sp.]
MKSETPSTATPSVRPPQVRLSRMMRCAGSTPSHFVRISFVDLRGATRQHDLPCSEVTDLKKVTKRLLDLGIPTLDVRFLTKQLTAELRRIDKQPPTELTDRTGWHGRSFVFPGVDLGAAGERFLFEGASPHAYTLSVGSAGEWKNGLGEALSRSPTHVFAMAAALAGPLLRFSGLPGDVVFLFTRDAYPSAVTVMQAASSVCTGAPVGAGERRIEPPYPSDMEERLFADLPRLLREDSDAAELLEQVTGRRLGYSRRKEGAVSGSSRSNAAVPRSLILATLDEGRDGGRLGACHRGAPDRLVMIVPGHPSATELAACHSFERAARQVASVCGRHAGHALRAFVAKVVADVDHVGQRIDREIRSFRSAVKSERALSEEEARALTAFGMVAATGVLAAEWGLVPWSKDQCIESCRHMALGHFRLRAEADDEPDLASIRAAALDDTRFPVVEDKQKLDPTAASDPWGIRRTFGGRLHLLVARDRLVDLVGSKESADALASRLAGRDGLVLKGSDDRVFRQVSVSGWPGGGGRQSWLCLDVDLLIRGAEPADPQICFAPIAPVQGPRPPGHTKPGVSPASLIGGRLIKGTYARTDKAVAKSLRQLKKDIKRDMESRQIRVAIRKKRLPMKGASADAHDRRGS